MTIRLGVAGALLVASAAGCAKVYPERLLRPEAFASKPAPTPQPIDAPGPLLYNDVQAEIMQPEEKPGGEGVSEISKTVRESIRPLSGGAAATRPATDRSTTARAATGPATTQGHTAANGASDEDGAVTGGAVPPTTSPEAGAGADVADPSGQFQVLGSVLANVNGVPIYADKVLAGLESALSAEAKNYTQSGFKVVAEQLISKEVKEYVARELEYAAAEKSLDAKDQALANMLTTQWRQRKITEAGGSEQLAQRKAAEDGQDFNEAVKEQYRVFLTQIYYQKKVVPLIAVTQHDIRAYYNDHLNTEFTDHGSARFRLIKVDPAQLPGMHAEAVSKVEEIRKRLAGGEDFAKIASGKSDNDDASLRSSGGDVGWIQKGAFRLDEVEKAVWQLKPGQVSDTIEAGGAIYLAKLEEVKPGKVKDFEDPAVQEAIKEKLRAEQFRRRRERRQMKLEQDAVIRFEDNWMNVALEMALQKYPSWAGKGK